LVIKSQQVESDYCSDYFSTKKTFDSHKLAFANKPPWQGFQLPWSDLSPCIAIVKPFWNPAQKFWND